MSVDISKYYPLIYKEVKETDEIIKVENEDFNLIEENLNSCIDNQFIMTSDDRGISHRESSLGILPDREVETIEFRRQRLLNRLTTKPPFTMIYLRERLDELLGVGQYKIIMDYNKYTLYIRFVQKDRSYQNEIMYLLNLIKPANIILEYSEYNAWYDVRPYTWGQVKSLTWEQLKDDPLPEYGTYAPLLEKTHQELKEYTYQQIEDGVLDE